MGLLLGLSEGVWLGFDVGAAETTIAKVAVAAHAVFEPVTQIK